MFKDDTFRYAIKQCQTVKDEVLVGTKPPKDRVFDKGDLSKTQFPQKKKIAASPLDPRVEARLTRGMLSELHLII